MTSLAWFASLGVGVIGALIGWLFSLQARRRMAREATQEEQRAERAERQHRKNHDGVVAELLAMRGERDQLRARVTTLEELRATLDKTAENLALVEARLATSERGRADAERRVVELTTSRITSTAETTSAQRKIAELDAQRRRSTVEAIEREQQLQRTLHRSEARARSLAVACQLDTQTAAPVYADRPAPLELDAISARVRGMALVDCTTISDRHGLPLDRNGSRDADDLAAMVPTVSRVALEIESVVGTVRSVIVYTGDSRVVELRSLPSWTQGAWLAAQASAQRPTPAALDAAVAYAHVVRDVSFPGERQIMLGARGRLGPGGPRSESLGDELDLAMRGLGARTVALVLGDKVLAGVATDGLTAGRLESVLHGLNQIARCAHASLRAHAIARVELDLVGAIRISLAQFGADSRLALVTHTVGRALDPLEVERVVGRLRRFLDATPTLASAPSSGPMAGVS